ncbi:unnamed protein product [Ectocarpus sp. CCAP 1310/34]|nr:unnamed protein product [Ectocarpus sp. CCAP 1310/34]
MEHNEEPLMETLNGSAASGGDVGAAAPSRAQEETLQRVSSVGEQEDDDDDEDDDYYPQELPEEEKTPVTVVTGFLGAGKTTLVNYILKEQREMKIAVIENEYGAVSIDTDLVEENVREAEDIVTMDNGCVCCTVRGDLVKALVNFLDRRDTFDCILLETTGIADPSPIVATFNQDMDVKANYRVDSVLCLVDAKNILRQLSRTSQEPGAVNEAVQQLAFADSVIINKTDLVSEEELKTVKQKITSVNAFAKVVQAEKSRVPLKSVLNLRSYNLERTLELLEQEAKEEEARKKAAEEKDTKEAKQNADKVKGGHAHGCKDGSCGHDHSHGHHDHKHEDTSDGHAHSHSHDYGKENGEKRKRDDEGGENGVANGADGSKNAKKARKKELVTVSSTRHDSKVGSMGLTLSGNLDVDMFNKFMGEFLRENSANLFRSKGVLAFKDQERKYVFQGVHEQIDCEPAINGWAEGEERESKIVFIGLDLDNDYITESLKACIVPEATEA